MALSEEQRQRIFEAADALAERGERPTLAAVRDELGGGSYTTISEGMQAWRAARQPRPEEATLPGELAEQARAQAAELWQAARKLAREEVEAERAALHQDREAMEQAQQEAARAADRAVEEAERLRGERDQAAAEAESQRRRAEEAAAETEQERRRAEQAEAERDRLAQQVSEQGAHLERMMGALERMAVPAPEVPYAGSETGPAEEGTPDEPG
ncbi:DNA-binding protein [Thiohalorhabdus denitrificans]|uniref:Replication region DNA-binding N-term n=1 Tax=Thiohalorhabdus denitrificans TaxID=381306 RepID=A0A1G5HGI0_9GAMM|nr:DNA-binding protein [Thiohalorhabdus denitrificans]SCY62579.1 replication region DNA-binding N-term [Thiohalorhabdus denitrificans]